VFISLKIVKELLPHYKLGHIVTVFDQMEYLRTNFLGKKRAILAGLAMARNEHLKKKNFFFFFTQTLRKMGNFIVYSTPALSFQGCLRIA